MSQGVVKLTKLSPAGKEQIIRFLFREIFSGIFLFCRKKTTMQTQKHLRTPLFL
ncbi:hypothetical protein [Effusibacillus dendaii]|uniref:hypothetical protein n=1 Tax=Effusibacillus dendaii TaxID=2743772 RepID=UPI00385130CD